MNTPRAVIDAWTAKATADPARIAALNATYKFVVSGAGGGIWVFRCRQPFSVVTEDVPADCTVRMEATDFVALANKNLNPQLAFMSGKLDVEGDLELALRLGELIDS